MVRVSFASDEQRDRASNWAKNRGLDWRDPEIREGVRDIYARKEGASKPNMPPGFWDEDQQRKRVFKYLKEHDDFGNYQTFDGCWNARAFDRNKYYGHPDHKKVKRPGTPDNFFRKQMPAKKTARAARKGNQTIKQKLLKQLGEEGHVNPGEEEKPPMKDLVPWGDDPNDTGNDFFTWYQKFILPDFATAWRQPHPLGKIHKRWSDELESDDLIIMLKPRDHYKTTFCSIGYVVYCLCERLYYPVLIVCLADRNVKNIWAAIKKHLTTNPRILERYGYLIDDNRPNSVDQGFFLTYQEAGVKDCGCFCATWYSHDVMGTHPKLVICDDIQERPLSQANMETAVGLLDASLLPAIGTEGKLIIVGTIKGSGVDNDIYRYMIAKGEFSVYEDPAVFFVDKKGLPIYTNEKDYMGRRRRKVGMPKPNDVITERAKIPRLDPRTGEPKINKNTGDPVMRRITKIVQVRDRWKYQAIYPEVYPLEEIIKKRILMQDPRKRGGGDARFWSEYFLKPFNPSGTHFSRERIGVIGEPGCPFHTVMGLIQTLKEEGLGTYLCVDPGGKKKKGIAISVFTPHAGDFYVIQLVTIAGGIHAAAAEIAKYIIQYHVIGWGIEGNFLQAETYGELIEEFVIAELAAAGQGRYTAPIIFQTKGDKILRISSQIEGLIGKTGSGKKKFWVNENAVDIDQFNDETKMFPVIPRGSNPTHEFDLCDSIACGNQYVVADLGGDFWAEAGESPDPLQFDKNQSGGWF